jgi:hypothetical protein
VPDLAAQPLSMQALADLIGRRPDLLRPLAAQFQQPPLPVKDAAELLEIYYSPLHSAEDCRRVLITVLALSCVARSRPATACASRGRLIRG